MNSEISEVLCSVSYELEIKRYSGVYVINFHYIFRAKTGVYHKIVGSFEMQTFIASLKQNQI